MNQQLQICKYTDDGHFLGGQEGCYNLFPVFDWVRHCIISIFLVFFIAFLPLFLQGAKLSPILLLSLTLYCRAVGTWYGACDCAFGQTVPVGVVRIRDLLHPDLLAGHSQQLDLRWCALHCNWSWFRYVAFVLRHPLLAVRRAIHLLRHAHPRPPALCHPHPLDAAFDLLLVQHHRPLRGAVRVQPAPVLAHRLHHRLPRVPSLDVAWQFAVARQLLGRLLPLVAHADYGLQEEAPRSPVREAVQRRRACWMEGHPVLRDHPASCCRDDLHCGLHVRQVVRRQDDGPVRAERSRAHRCHLSRSYRLQRRHSHYAVLHLALPGPDA